MIVPPDAPAGDAHAWHLYPLRLAAHADISRDHFIERLYALGIGCSVHYIPLHLQPYWRDRYGLTPAMFPHSQQAYEGLLSLPAYSLMGDDDTQRVIDAVRGLLA